MYYYDKQIKKYIIQVANIFAGMSVEFGATENTEAGLISVDLHYGSRDRVAASLMAGNTQNKPPRLPIISVYVSGLDMAPERRKGVGQVERQTYLPTGGLIPDDISVVHRYMPIPYNMQVEVSIFTSNQEQHMQLLEQILMLFDPMLQIQTSDKLFDWTKITQVELLNIRFDENYPAGLDDRAIQTVLDFKVPIYIAPPAQVRQDYIEKIKLRVNTTDIGTELTDVVSEFDANGIDYTTVVSTDDIISG